MILFSTLLVVVAVACGTTTHAARLSVAVTTVPADADVIIRYGDRVLESGPAPFTYDGTRNVTVQRTAGYWVATIAGALVAGTSLALASVNSRDLVVQEAYVMIGALPGFLACGVGLAGLLTAKDPPFFVDASRSGDVFTPRQFEPSEVRQTFVLGGISRDDTSRP